MLRTVAVTLLLLPLVLIAAPPVHAQEAPDALVKRIAEETLTTIRSDKELQAGNPAKVKQLIESKLVPNFDTARMTALAMGRNWRSARATESSTRPRATCLVMRVRTSLSSAPSDCGSRSWMSR